MALSGEGYEGEALKALNRTSFFGFGKTQKFEDAADAYVSAGNAYKRASNWQKAGECFEKASECWSKADPSTSDIANNLAEAAACFKKVDPEKSCILFEQVANTYENNSRFGMAAKTYKDIAEMQENDGNIKGALSFYEKAYDCYVKDHKEIAANQCLLKKAVLSTDDNQLMSSSEIFSNMGLESLKSRLGMYSAKGYFLQAVLCLFALGDLVAIEDKLESFKNADYTFASSRECGFLEKILEVCSL